MSVHPNNPDRPFLEHHRKRLIRGARLAGMDLESFRTILAEQHKEKNRKYMRKYMQDHKVEKILGIRG